MKKRIVSNYKNVKAIINKEKLLQTIAKQRGIKD